MRVGSEDAAHDAQSVEEAQEDQHPLLGQLSGIRNSEVAAPTDLESGISNGVRSLFWWVWGSGSACIALAAMCTSISALCIKLMAGQIPAFEIVMVRGAFSWAATHALGRLQHIKPLYGSRNHFAVLAVRGVTGAVATSFTYEAYPRLLLSEAMTLYFIHPAITVLMAWLVLGELATWVSVAGCGISLLGVVFIAKPPFLFGHSMHYTSQHWLGVAFAFASALNLAAALTAVFLAHLWGICFLHEHETPTSITGSILLLGGVVTVSFSKAKATTPVSHDGQALAGLTHSKAFDLELAEVASNQEQRGSSSIEWQQADLQDDEVVEIGLATQVKQPAMQ